MTISVVMPLFNKEKRIALSIDSVLKQDNLFELIVIDDGSTDGSPAIVKGIDDKRLRYIRQDNAGPAAARNHGVREAKGEWVLFLDADDELLPGAVSHFMNLIKNNPGINVFSCNFLTSSNGKRELYSRHYKEGILRNNYRSWFFKQLMPCQGSTVYKKDLLLAESYNENLRRYEDAEILFNIMRSNKWYTSTTPSFVYYKDSTSASMPRKTIKEDFCGYVDFRNKSLWEQVALYDFYSMAFELYSDEAAVIYRTNKAPFKARMIYDLSKGSIKMFVKIKQFMRSGGGQK